MSFYFADVSKTNLNKTNYAGTAADVAQTTVRSQAHDIQAAVLRMHSMITTKL
jgi:hypothetical protein